jgi:hypothetical protein
MCHTAMVLIYKQNLINFNICAELSNAPSQIKPEKIHNSNFTKLLLYQRFYMDVKLENRIEVIKGRSKQQR